MTTATTKLKSGMQSYADTATDVAPLTANGQATTERPESRKRWILNAFDVSADGFGRLLRRFGLRSS